MCEYDEEELEFWVNTRTSGTLSREDLQKLSISQEHEGQVGGCLAGDLGLQAGGGFSDICGDTPELSLEGDAGLEVSKPHEA